MVEVNGVNLFQSDIGAGQSVVLVHGIGGDYRSWSSQVDALSREYRVLTYSRRMSFPNQNRGDILTDTIANNSEDLAELIKKLGIAPVHLVGHSLGGFVAAYFASQHPEMLRSLVLVEPAVSGILLTNPNSRLQLLIFFLSHPSTAIAAANFSVGAKRAIKILKENGDSKKAAQIFVDTIQNTQGAFDRFPEEFRKIVTDNANTILDVDIPPPQFTKEDTRRISTPTLLIKGETSHKILRVITFNLSRYIPNSKLVSIGGSGHFPQIEKPEEFNSILKDFLRRRSGKPT